MQSQVSNNQINNNDGKDAVGRNKSPFRPFYIVIGLLSFAFILVAGVAISQRQQLLRGPLAPTAPESQPAAAGDSAISCDLVFTVE